LYPFDEGEGAIAYDLSSNGYNGSLTDMDLETCWDLGGFVTPSSLLSFFPTQDSIPGAGAYSESVSMVANTGNLGEGIYVTSATIIHNDPNQPNPLTIPVEILVDMTAPVQVNGLAYIPYMFEIDLSWDSSPEEDLAEYRIYRDLSLEDTTWIATVTAPNTSFIDNDIPDDDEIYHYRVSAVDAVGNEGAMSEAITTWLDIPGPITDLAIHPEGMDIHLNWTVVDTTVYGHPLQNLTGYLVYFNEYAYEDTLFSFHAFTEDTIYVHQHAGQFADAMFYRVTAYAGPLRLLNQIVAENPDMKLGELDGLLGNLGIIGRESQPDGIRE